MLSMVQCCAATWVRRACMCGLAKVIVQARDLSVQFKSMYENLEQL